MKKLLLQFIMLTVAFSISTAFTACSSDEEEDTTKSQEEIDGTDDVDELDVLQQNLVRTDSLGKFERRVFGTSLDKSDSTIVSVGVDSYEEAQEKFQSLFSDTTAISIDGNVATFTLQDGTVELVKQDGTDGLVATVKFNLKGLKYISQINFILNSAWPENAKSKGYHKYGTWYQYHGWTGDWKDTEWNWFLCIREYSNGKPALLVAFSPDKYYLGVGVWGHQDMCGNMKYQGGAKEIQRIIGADFEKYKKLYNDKYGKTIMFKNEKYWLRSYKHVLFVQRRYTIRLSDGDIEWHDVNGPKPEYTAMFCIESMEVSQ